MQEIYDLERRGQDIVGSRTMLSWEGSDETPTSSNPIPITEGRFEDGRVRFCIRLHTFDEGKFHPFKDCYDGLLDRDRMDVLIHTNIGHPFGPERIERVKARRVSDANRAESTPAAQR